MNTANTHTTPNILSAEELDNIDPVEVLAMIVALSIRGLPIAMDYAESISRRDYSHDDVIATKLIVEKVLEALDTIDAADWTGIDRVPTFTLPGGFKYFPRRHDQEQIRIAAMFAPEVFAPFLENGEDKNEEVA